ncbi:hypothetical protein EVAR_23868_1 [Eumeta japonica]|uniref:Uncharacterized protein n=1 Tax=Eumeta variegata TaxID=151549 RepID=A0A4C1V5G3_EUMVA|nr:hypothetical protein EVAR_23868_1 [Eumeta japonica]
MRVGPPTAEGSRSGVRDKASDRRSFSGSSRFSIVEFLRSGRSSDPPLHHALLEPAVTVEEDDGESTDTSSGPPADSGPQVGPRKGAITIGSVGVVLPTRRRPDMRQQISPPSRTCDQGKVVDDPRTNDFKIRAASSSTVDSRQWPGPNERPLLLAITTPRITLIGYDTASAQNFCVAVEEALSSPPDPREFHGAFPVTMFICDFYGRHSYSTRPTQGVGGRRDAGDLH